MASKSRRRVWMYSSIQPLTESLYPQSTSRAQKSGTLLEQTCWSLTMCLCLRLKYRCVIGEWRRRAGTTLPVPRRRCDKSVIEASRAIHYCISSLVSLSRASLQCLRPIARKARARKVETCGSQEAEIQHLAWQALSSHPLSLARLPTLGFQFNPFEPLMTL